MAVNRFANSSQISESIFLGLVYDFVLGLSPSASAERLGVSIKTTRRYYEKIRERFIKIHTVRISGEIKGFPEPDDQIWLDVYKCLFNCPSKVEHDYEFSHRDQSPNWTLKQRNQKIRVPDKRYLNQCPVCPLKCPFELPEVLDFIISMKISNQRGFKPENFGKIFIEEYFRRLYFKPSKIDFPAMMLLVNELLQDALVDPL